MAPVFLLAHGETTHDRLFVVPENTFIVFMGESATKLVSGIKTRMLLSADSESEYWVNLFDSLYGADPAGLRRSSGYICSPGDVLQDIALDFINSKKGAQYLGVYCPPLSPALSNEIVPLKRKNNGSFILNLTKILYLTKLFSLLREGVVGPDLLDSAGFKSPDKKTEFDALFAKPALTEDEEEKSLEEFFEKPNVLYSAIDTIVFSKEENLLLAPTRAGVFNQKEGIHLTELMRFFEEHREFSGPMFTKPYRIFFVEACRGALNAGEKPKTLKQRIQRRLSVSGKLGVPCARPNSKPNNIRPQLAYWSEEILGKGVPGVVNDYLIYDGTDPIKSPIYKRFDALNTFFQMAFTRQSIPSQVFADFLKSIAGPLDQSVLNEADRIPEYDTLFVELKQLFGIFLEGVYENVLESSIEESMNMANENITQKVLEKYQMAKPELYLQEAFKARRRKTRRRR